MIKKKISKLVLGLVVGGMLLTGCSNNADEESSGSEEAKEFNIGISQLDRKSVV